MKKPFFDARNIEGKANYLEYVTFELLLIEMSDFEM